MSNNPPKELASVKKAEDVVRGRFKPYPKYRHSGIEWLGEIPEHWKVNRMKHIAIIQPQKMKAELFGDMDVSFVPMEYIGEYGGIDASEVRPVCDVYWGYTYFEENDILIAKITPCFENFKGAIAKGLHNNIGFGTTELYVLRPKSNVYCEYLAYITFGAHFRQLGKIEMRGAAGQQRVPEEFIKNFPCALPPYSEQKKIAEFLTLETKRIDRLIEKKQKLIELLKERRAALVNQAVTKGLDPNVAMKDSGIEWLGEIPAHWEVIRTKYAARLETGHTPSRHHPEYWENCIFPWFSLADVWQIRNEVKEYVYNTKERISEIGLRRSSARLLPKGTVLVSRTASVGFSAIMGTEMATTQDFVNWICGSRIKPEYLLYVFRSMKYEFKRLTMGSTHQTIYMKDVEKFCSPIPPIQDQEKIVSFIRAENVKTEKLVGKIKEAITRLEEYRSALITAAVTGKIDVRGE